MSFPAVLDSRFLAASLGYLRNGMLCMMSGCCLHSFLACVCVKDILWWSQHLLQVLLYFVDICKNLPLEGEERWVCSWSQVVKVCWFSNQSRIISTKTLKHIFDSKLNWKYPLAATISVDLYVKLSTTAFYHSSHFLSCRCVLCSTLGHCYDMCTTVAVLPTSHFSNTFVWMVQAKAFCIVPFYLIIMRSGNFELWIKFDHLTT